MDPLSLSFAGASILSVAVLGYFYRCWVGGGVCGIKKDLQGKVAIITGSNTGIGFQTAQELASQGCHVFLACRNHTLGKEAVDKIKQNLKLAQVEFSPLDLSDLSSVRSFAKSFLSRNLPLHFLVNNAGVMAIPERTLTKDGFEMQFGTNHLGHFLLTILLLPCLRSSAPSRVVNLSSLASERPSAKIHLEDLNLQNNYDGWLAYRQSKLANVLFTRELARREKERNTGVTTYSSHPGAVSTDLGRHLPILAQLIIKIPLVPLLIPFKTAWQGAQTSLYCCLSDEILPHSGAYFADCALKKKNPNHLAYDDDTAKRLWEASEKLVGENSP